MTESIHAVITKTAELEEELKITGLWQKQLPAWVQGFDANRISSTTDFAQWLQFVFIPNHLQKNSTVPIEKNLIVPHAIKYFGDDVKKGKLLQILIELDSLL